MSKLFGLSAGSEGRKRRQKPTQDNLMPHLTEMLQDKTPTKGAEPKARAGEILVRVRDIKAEAEAMVDLETLEELRRTARVYE